MRIAQSLVDGPEDGFGTLERDLRVEFPVTHVGDGENDSPTVQDISLDPLAVHERSDAQDGFFWQAQQS